MEKKEVIETALQNATSSSSVQILPEIYFKRTELEEILEEIEVATEIHAQAQSHLKTLEQKIDKINKYRLKQNPHNFYQSIKTLVLDIRNIAHSLFELLKPYDMSLPNTLKDLILKKIEPLDQELSKRLEMPQDDRKALELKTKHLYAEQSLVSRTLDLQRRLMKYLNTLKELLADSDNPNPRCYISYAWPSKENQAQEYWVQPQGSPHFLKSLF